MAEIKTGLGGYKTFIRDMRAAFDPAVPFTASYGGTNFNYVVQGGALPNLYLTSITKGGLTRNLSEAELSYSKGATGDITTDTLINALSQNFVAAGAWEPPVKKAFDIMLLCTVEAARSKYIYEKVNLMLSKNTISGDHLKAVAQMYGHTTAAAGIRRFKALDTRDYHALYANVKGSGNVALDTFAAMGVGY
ncbi:MAG TPA: hypothetical protein VH436_09445 [Vicinamibacterales bacterium]